MKTFSFRLGKAFSLSLGVLCLSFSLSGCGGGDSTTSNTDEHTSSRIVNGIAIDQSELPPVKRLFLNVPGQDPQFLCSGTFISPIHFLTAAHCVVFSGVGQIPAEYLAVEIEPGIIAPASGVASHAGYQPDVTVPSAEIPNLTYFPGDIALVVTSSPYEGPVAPVSTRFPGVGQEILIAGFGQYQSDIPSDQALRYGVTTIDAISMLDGVFYWLFDGFHESNTCYGDSGGPAFVRFAEEEPLVLVGITSGGGPTCEPYSISFDTLVPHPAYIEFINQITVGFHSQL